MSGDKPSNRPLQRSGIDKMLGRGRERLATNQVWRARVLNRARPAADRGC